MKKQEINVNEKKFVKTIVYILRQRYNYNMSAENIKKYIIEHQ